MNHKLMYVVGIVVVLMQLLAVLLPYWGKKGDTYVGLWQGCFEKQHNGIYVDICADMDKLDKNDPNFPKDALNVCRTFAILATIFSFLSLMCMMFCSSRYRELIMVMFAASGICSLVAISVWSSKMSNLKGYNNNPNASWYFMLTGGVLMFGMAGYYMWNRDSSSMSSAPAVSSPLEMNMGSGMDTPLEMNMGSGMDTPLSMNSGLMGFTF